MLDDARLAGDLQDVASPDWIERVTGLCREKLADGAHGDLPRWRNAIAALPQCVPSSLQAENGAVTSHPELSGSDLSAARETLLTLAPWRKGPFRIDDMDIDTEWRSDLKWDRLADAISPLEGRLVADIGGGNGYYALRMRNAGAKLVLVADPTILFTVQFAAISHFIEAQPVHVLPLRLHELPAGAPAFDTVFSMGVLYHQRVAGEHLDQLRVLLRPGGELVLETLVIPGEEPDFIVPEKRYARMRNVWHLPTVPCLLSWLTEAGFSNPVVIDESTTTVDEQRTTEWMPFESLREALDPQDPSRTIEGLPAPRRVVITAVS